MNGATESDSLHAYYMMRGMSPTACRFQSTEELDRYAASRVILFRDHLKLPVRLFDGASVIEMGPDTGENALVFARWGANITLVEPNPQVHPRIQANFDRFGLGDRVVELRRQDLESFSTETPADFITAEGFIYTCRPVEPWMQVLAGSLKPDGFAILSYYEKTGCLIELTSKMLVARIKAMTGEDSITVAERLFDAKWRTIGHTRRFESWVMDVLDNPFVRRAWFLDATELCTQMEAHGFELYSAWPTYADGRSVHWHKRVPLPTETSTRRDMHLARSCISFALGRTLYLAGDPPVLAGTYEAIQQLLDAIDRLIDALDEAALARAFQLLDRLVDSVSLNPILAYDSSDIDLARDLFRGLSSVLRSLADGDADAVARFMSEDETFLSLWGAPAHYAVFRRTA